MYRTIPVFRLTTLLLTLGLASIADAATVHFVVAESSRPVHGDSYILPLEDPEDIAHARSLIAGGPAVGSPIVVARIEKGSDGINRDLLAPGEPLWSWHVAQFEEFVDMTAEVLDGWPGFVEQDVDGWIGNTGGRIGFWNYTVVAELDPIPVPGALALFASALGTLAVRCSRRRMQSVPQYPNAGWSL